MRLRLVETGRVCGRYASADEGDVIDLFDVKEVSWRWVRSWNVCPTDLVGIVVEDAGRARREGRPVVREVRAARWGLVPSWTTALDGRRLLINARAETLTVKPSFRAAAARRRAVVPASGYYEWAAGPGRRKTPFFLRPEDGGVLGFAGVYEWWRVPDGVSLPGVEDGWLCSMAIVTRPAMDSIGNLHDRMPVVVPGGLVDEWLSPDLTKLGDVADLVAAMPDPMLVPIERSPTDADTV